MAFNKLFLIVLLCSGVLHAAPCANRSLASGASSGGPADPLGQVEPTHSQQPASESKSQTREHLFGAYMRRFNKSYSADELPGRMESYMLRRAAIEQSERRFRAGESKFALGENQFTDWFDHELAGLTGALHSSEAGLAREPEWIVKEDLELSDSELPEEVNWEDSGCVGPVRHQAHCGSCYAMATVSVLETMHCLNSGVLERLSVQQVVDCSTEKDRYTNLGCRGGFVRQVFNYWRKTKVVSTEDCYPYEDRNQSCRLDGLNASCTRQIGANLLAVKLESELEIQRYVAMRGPVVADIYAPPKLSQYKHGIINEEICTVESFVLTNHDITVVGYGSENGTDYWLVKNSWGEDWGDRGYGKLKRGANVCLIGTGWGIRLQAD